jgi:hypothetical protein
MESSGSRFVRPGIERLESREVPSTILTGHECLVFYLGVVPQSEEYLAREGHHDLSEDGNEIRISSRIY